MPRFAPIEFDDGSAMIRKKTFVEKFYDDPFDGLPSRSLSYIIPEFCHADFFHGWHIYERERIDGSRNSDGDWGWFQGALSIMPVRNLCVELGYVDMPAVTYDTGSGRYREFVDEFAVRFPLGIRVRKHAMGYEAVPLGLDINPDRISQAPRLYFSFHGGITKATVATSLKEADWLLL